MALLASTGDYLTRSSNCRFASSVPRPIQFTSKLANWLVTYEQYEESAFACAATVRICRDVYFRGHVIGQT